MSTPLDRSPVKKDSQFWMIARLPGETIPKKGEARRLRTGKEVQVVPRARHKDLETARREAHRLASRLGAGFAILGVVETVTPPAAGGVS